MITTHGAKAVAKVVKVNRDEMDWLEIRIGETSITKYIDVHDHEQRANLTANKINAALSPILKAKYVEGYKRGLEVQRGLLKK